MAADQQRPPVAPYILYHTFRPQIAIYSSSDVDDLAAANGLRNLAQLLKPWEASVERVTLRTSTFASHVVPVFPLLIDDARDLAHTELDVHFLDSLAESITQRMPGWLASMDLIDVHDDCDRDLWKEGTIEELTPWYSYYRETLINLRPRTEYETFGHPVACMLAVSTSNPEPLNAFAELYEATSPDKLFADKPWVDPNVLRYYVLVHDMTIGPAEDFVPLLEDVRRAYGLHTNMLILNDEAALKPDSAYIDASRRPQPKPADFSKHWATLSTSHNIAQSEPDLEISMASIAQPSGAVDASTTEFGAKLGQEDVRRIKLFLREFVVQNLAPWLERTTTLLNEQLAANRKGIAGRLFSAGRRYFGSRPASPAPGNAGATSAFDPINGFYRHTSHEAQTRKLADFAFMIADYRLASAHYELARKDFLGDKAWRYYSSATRMAGLLHLLLRKGSTGIAAIAESDQYLEQAANSPTVDTAQLDGLRAIALYYELYQEQEDWHSASLALAKFASDIEELPSALMIEQAAMALLRLPHPARRRFALLMTIAAHRYQKTGPKSLADRCGRQALTLFSDLDRKDWIEFRNYLERMLGRQAFNDGKPELALAHFLRILVQGSEGNDACADQDFLDSLELAWARLGDEADQTCISDGLMLPQRIFDPRHTVIHAEVLNPTTVRSDIDAWTSLEQTFLDNGFPYIPDYSTHCIERPMSLIEDATASIVIVGEHFVVDLLARNELAIPVILNDIKVVFDVSGEDCDAHDLVTDGVQHHVLEPNSSAKVSVKVKAANEGTFTLRAVKFRYNGILACNEDLERKGARLYATKAHLLERTYAEDTTLRIIVKPPQPILQVTCDVATSDIYAGETLSLPLTLVNAGSCSLRGLRVLCDAPHIASAGGKDGSSLLNNSMQASRPSIVPLEQQSLGPGGRTQWHVSIRSGAPGPVRLHWLFVFQSDEQNQEERKSARLYTTCYTQEIMVKPFLALQPSLAQHSSGSELVLSIDVENSNLSTPVNISGLAILSHLWRLKAPHEVTLLSLDPGQAGRFDVPLERFDNPEDSQEISAPTLNQLDALLHGRDLADKLVSDMNMTFSSTDSLGVICTTQQLRAIRTETRFRSLQQQFPSLEEALLAKVFPLYLPSTLDAIVFWRLPRTNRQGWHYIPDVQASPANNFLGDLIRRASITSGGGRYEESARDRARLLQQLQSSDLGRSACPISVRQSASISESDATSPRRTSACLFQVNNTGLEKVSCTLELRFNNVARPVQSVRWIGRLAFRCTLPAGGSISWKGRYISPEAVQDQGAWLLTVTNGDDNWQLTGSESLVGI